eukprot:TRINITY_DN3699_c0_g1_i2.p1 TRINITY_DN3699_c0_g1~~TRINITY_DN3699_c0_g1_i2.p1  ORF type:complete len:703 (+),score=279.52 TRINITY_DN3699_c0_g1_i2:170-2278(+)
MKILDPLADDFVKMEVSPDEYAKSPSDIKKLFLNETKFMDHYDAQKNSFSTYTSVLIILLSQKAELSIGTKSRILAACWATKHLDMMDYLINGLRQLPGTDGSNFVFGLAEILKALNLLDSGRKMRQLEKRLKKLEGNPKVKPLTISTTKAKMNELKNEPVPYGSVSGALCRNIVAWVSSLPSSVLEFYALNLPKEPWRELANIIHLSPTDFQLSWFLDYVFDKEAPADSVVGQTKKIFYKEEKEILEIMNRWKLPYSYLRRQLLGTLANESTAEVKPKPTFRRYTKKKGKTAATAPARGGRGGRGGARGVSRGSRGGRGSARGGRGGRPVKVSAPKPEVKSSEPKKEEEPKEVQKFFELTLSMKEAIAAYSPVDTIIWWHEDLQCSAVDAALVKRLKEEEITFGYGKLMERMLYAKSNGYPFLEQLMPIAEKRLNSLSLPLEKPVVVCGDASGSMQVAVKTATIISSLLTVLTSAELRFFRTFNEMPPVQPRTIKEVLRVADEVRADGGTTPAACLFESYKKKEVVKCFVIVTDEEENGHIEGMNWATLFKKYREEVCADTKLVFISFLRNPKDKGQMMTDLEKDEIRPMQFKLNSSKPDLTKMDTFLAHLSSESTEFKKNAEEYARELRAGFKFFDIVKKAHKFEIVSTFKKGFKHPKKEKKPKVSPGSQTETPKPSGKEEAAAPSDLPAQKKGENCTIA